MIESPANDLSEHLGDERFGTVLADPPWRFANRTGKVAPEHRRLSRYGTLSLEEIAALPVADHVAERAHCYLWVPNALLPEGLHVLGSWGFQYKTNLIWHKVRKDGGSDGRGVGFYFRNVTEVILFGVRGKEARTLPPGRSQVNLIASRKREHSRKPDEQYELIESCSWGPYLELFGRGKRENWTVWGSQATADYEPDWPTYSHNSGGRFALSLSDLEGAGFNVQTVNHALAILTSDFSSPLEELCAALLSFRIADVELIKGGGGEANSTQRLRRSLTEREWVKQNIVIRKTVDDVERAAISHEIDHVRRTDNGSIALEIEWNNKDPFFDRDLENFQRLHSEGAISVGIIVTRGRSLQNSVVHIVTTCAISHGTCRELRRLGTIRRDPDCPSTPNGQG